MSSNIFSWNVRGFNKYSHRTGFKKWFKVNKPIFGGLIETHVKQHKDNKFVSEIMSGWFFEDNYAFLELGKIWFLWHPSVKVVVIGKSLHIISCQVTLPNFLSTFLVSIVYASNCHVERSELWAKLVSLADDQRDLNLLWIVLGDFNQISSPNEHSAPPSLNVDAPTRAFNDCLLESGLSDLNYRGGLFTWWNKQKSSPVAKKLDRILINDSWSDLFPNSVAFFDSPDFSDHASMKVVLNSQLVSKKRPFKFFNFLLQNPDFLSMVTLQWHTYPVFGSAMFRVSRKLKLLKKDI